MTKEKNMNKASLVSLEAVYIYISRLLEKENRKISKIDLDYKITIKPKN